ncbi:unnamed protein product [Pieris brassicae]|uniref:VM domain-containing protein n=1 Tax=Pieris brassicae TaxID=7116 RepID=A0A9P0SH25_PIEBR|nr:unnamed protein product [Pieris brassicae]
MFSKIVAFGAFLAAANASGHGHAAVSSQSIVHHGGYAAPLAHGHGAQLAYAAPVAYGAPAGPLAHGHGAQLAYAAPVAYAAPAAHYDGHDTYIQRGCTQLCPISSPRPCPSPWLPPLLNQYFSCPVMLYL